MLAVASGLSDRPAGPGIFSAVSSRTQYDVLPDLRGDLRTESHDRREIASSTLEPDAEHVVEQGLLLHQGPSLSRGPSFPGPPPRVPLKRVGDRFEEISWAQALDGDRRRRRGSS